MQDIRQVYNCIFNPYRTVLDSAHIQHIIDQAEQMLTGYMDFFQIIQNKLLIVNMCCRKRSKSNDRIHRRADIMRHIIQKHSLRPVRMFRSRKCISQIPILRNLTFFFFCRITDCNQNCTQFPIFIISLWHNNHCHPSFIHCPSCKTQRFTFFQTFCHCTYIDKFPVCLLKWLCNHLPYKFFLMRFEKHIPFLIWLHIS